MPDQLQYVYLTRNTLNIGHIDDLRFHEYLHCHLFPSGHMRA